MCGSAQRFSRSYHLNTYGREFHGAPEYSPGLGT